MRAAALSLAVLVLGGAAPIAASEAIHSHYLTQPRSGDPLAIALDFLQGAGAAAGRAPVDHARHRVADRYTDARSGATHLVLRQRIDGLEVWNGDAIVSVSADGEVMSAHDRFAPAPLRAIATPTLAAPEAIAAAAEALGLPLDAPPVAGADGRYACPGVSLDPIPAKLMLWLDDAREPHPVWNLVVREPGGGWWELNVDARSGALRSQVDWSWDDAYRVFALPVESPDDGERSLVVDPADPTASPFGWHDVDGSPGAESLSTSGNNVAADADRNADDVLDASSPSGGAGLVFDLPFDPEQPVDQSLQAAIANAFYWSNLSHDIHYHYGFDEPAGNFQVNGYGAPGAAGDPVIVHVQDSELRNNARMAVPPDGTPGLLELFLFDPFPSFELVSPAARYKAGGADFGPAPAGETGEVVLGDDGVPPTGDGCSPIGNDVAGRIVLVDRGSCFFVEKALHAQAAGAIAIVIANHEGDRVFTMGQADPPQADPLIPSLLIGLNDGAQVKAALTAGPVSASLEPASAPDRDAAFDSGVVVHEYGHGVSTRRVGGPANSSCLDALQARGMGEGWSDFWALAFTARPEDLPGDPRTIAGYLLFDSQPVGFRNFPYATDLATNPRTYADLPGLVEEHDVGEIWAAALWDLYWNLVDAEGFDPDLVAGSGGNNTALQLVMDALPLHPCEPTLLDGRDALLLADVGLSGSANECAIWRAFARRGMGVEAADGGSSTTNQVTADFGLPVQCPEPGPALLGLAAFLANGVAALRIRLRGRQPACRSIRVAGSGRPVRRS